MTENPGPTEPAAYPPPYPGYPPPGVYPYGYGAPPAPPAPPKRNGLGTTALVLGILALVFSCTSVLGIVLGAVAIVLGIVGVGRAKRGEADNMGVSIAGAVLGGLGLIAGIAVAVFWFSMMNSMGFNNFFTCVSEAKGDQSRITQCQNDFQQRMNEQYGITTTVRPTP